MEFMINLLIVSLATFWFGAAVLMIAALADEITKRFRKDRDDA